MKKRNLNDLFIGILIGGLIFGGIGVAAITLNADQIKYTPSNNKFTVTNIKEAMDEIYKLAEYEVPSDTYFYNSETEGENIVRYKKIDGKYYLCDKNGKVINNEEQNVSNIPLKEYETVTEDAIGYSAGYADGMLNLGNGLTKLSNDVKVISVIHQSPYQFATKYDNYPINIDVSDYNYAYVGVMTVNQAHELRWRLRLDGVDQGQRNGLIDISNISNLKVEAYTGNNYSAPLGYFSAVVVVAKEIEQFN